MLARLFQLYYAIKYLPLRLWHLRGPMERKGFVGIQIDGLAHAHLEEALQRGLLPRLRRRLDRHEYKLHAFPAGLPSATSYAQAGFFYGVNDNIPAFRWYEREDRKVVNCNRPHSAEYLRRRIGERKGVLRGGSSYVNLIDGDADRVALTANSSVPRPFFEELGGFRILLLILLHPVRVLMTLVATVREVFLELYDRYLAGEKRHAVAEGWFPLVRALSSVVLREVQTVAVMADVYAGVPYIFTTFASYDELGHHYGPASRPALKNLRPIFGRILEIEKIIRRLPGRHYDLIVLSDHGQTPGHSFLGLFEATLGEALHQHLEGRRVRVEAGHMDVPLAGTRGIYADHVRRQAAHRSFVTRALRHALARWLQRMTSIETYTPEKYYVDQENDVVVTYSGTLALVYFSRFPHRLSDGQLRQAFPEVLHFLVHHPGIGLVVTQDDEGGAILRSEQGTARLRDGQLDLLDGHDPLAVYKPGPIALRALERLAGFTNAGDLMLFGAYDGANIVCFDDQVGSHGCLGGPQFWPFLLVPNDPRFDQVAITDPRDFYAQVFEPYHPPDDTPD
ncbi:MAG: alkaline phosphatase family protein [Candidatus Brocadiia bacterium]